MNFKRSSRRRTQTRGRPETPPPAPQQQPHHPPKPYPPAYPPQTGNPNPGGVPPTLPGRPPVDPRYPNPNYPQPQYPPQTPPGYPAPGQYPPPGYPQQPGPPPPVYHPVQPPPPPERRRRARPQRQRRFLRFRPGCLLPLLLLLLLAGPLALYFLAPIRTNVTLIGVDYIDPALVDSYLARTDTIIIATVVPSKPYVGMVSIPRDLWVTIPNVGENRINTAHFFAEGAQPGSGPQALRETIALNFGVDIPYYVRIRFEGFREIVDALGGVDIELEAPMAGYPAGKHHLTGRKALAFVRDRANSDDFNRMGQGQVMVRALFRNLLNPLKWPRLPAVADAFFGSVDTNLPKWMWPRLGLALLRAGPSGIDSHIINREMVSPFITSEGAQVLAPNWPAIHALVEQVFR